MFRSTLAMAALCIVSIAALSGIAMADNHGNDNNGAANVADTGSQGTHHAGTDPPGYCYADDIQSCRPGDKVLHATPAPPVDPQWAKKHH